MKIEHVEKLQSSDAYGYCILAHAEEMIAGNSSWNEVAFDYECRAAVIRYRGKVIGLIAWKKIEYRSCCFIAQSWVNPKFRRRGIYRQLYQAVCAEARKLGCLTIQSGIVPSNNRMVDLAKRQGRKAVAVMYEGTL